jgi:hypothetical protein
LIVHTVAKFYIDKEDSTRTPKRVKKDQVPWKFRCTRCK